MKAYPIVEVRWLDALELGGWTEHKDVVNKPMPSRTVGFLIRESDEALCVAALVNKNHVGLAVVIPRGMVTSVRHLKGKR